MLDEDIKKLIIQQIKMLSDESKNVSDNEALIAYSHAIAELANIIKY